MNFLRTALVFVAGSSFFLLAACGSDSTSTLGDAGGGDPDAGAPPTGAAQANIATGEKQAKARKCTECHNSEKGVMSGRTTPLPTSETGVELYPPNLTPDMETGIGDGAIGGPNPWTDDKLATAMRTGFDKNGLQLCPQMKHDSTMSDFETYSIVKWLRSLPAVKNTIPRSVCPPLKDKSEQSQGR